MTVHDVDSKLRAEAYDATNCPPVAEANMARHGKPDDPKRTIIGEAPEGGPISFDPGIADDAHLGPKLGLTEREMSEQVLDNMDIERERGITIKAQTVRLTYKARDGETYELNLMDTPGHVDFAYEVSRSLAACEGALLVVDAAQGVEAQTLANVYQSIEHDHEIVPVINKIDLPAAEPEKVRAEIEEVIGIDASEAVLASAKSGIGIAEVLEAIVTKIPPPKGDRAAPLKAMLEQHFRGDSRRPVHLFWGARARRDLYLHALAEDWARQHPQLRYTPVLSEPDGDWAGERGFVHEAVLRAHPDLAGHEIYMAGPPVMVHAGKQAFVQAGLDADHLYYDSFDYAFETWGK